MGSCEVTPTAKWYVDRFLSAFEEGRDELIVELHKELNESQELYCEVFGYLSSTMRRQIKLILSQHDHP
jgi:hypothetical protein